MDIMLVFEVIVLLGAIFILREARKRHRHPDLAHL